MSRFSRAQSTVLSLAFLLAAACLCSKTLPEARADAVETCSGQLAPELPQELMRVLEALSLLIHHTPRLEVTFTEPLIKKVLGHEISIAGIDQVRSALVEPEERHRKRTQADYVRARQASEALTRSLERLSQGVEYLKTLQTDQIRDEVITLLGSLERLLPAESVNPNLSKSHAIDGIFHQFAYLSSGTLFISSAASSLVLLVWASGMLSDSRYDLVANAIENVTWAGIMSFAALSSMDAYDLLRFGNVRRSLTTGFFRNLTLLLTRGELDLLEGLLVDRRDESALRKQKDYFERLIQIVRFRRQTLIGPPEGIY